MNDKGASNSGIELSAQTWALILWLALIFVLLFGMVVLGGVTRLTDAGLSMVDWRPLTGILPPLTELQWQSVFEKYQAFPEYQKVNQGMELAGFKSIFWLEYLHRLLGRLIGLVFLLPFLYFWVRGYLTPRLVRWFFAIFILGGLQGLLGWYMVKSGLIDRPDVSQYRLAAHLGLAFLILGAVLWVILELVSPVFRRSPQTGSVWPAWLLLGLIYLQVLSGGVVAGIDAGLIYNTWPLMEGSVIPPGLLFLDPWTVNFFENHLTVQFDHRILAYVLLVAAGVGWLRVVRRGAPRGVQWAHAGVFGALLVQAGLGVATLLSGVPIALAAGHQAGAMVVLSAAVILLWACLHPGLGAGTPPRDVVNVPLG